MDGGFTSWLRDNSLCRNCESHLSGLCGKEMEILPALRDCCPVQSFRPDPDAPARKCDWWEAELDWKRRMSRSWDDSVKDERSYIRHIHGVWQIKGYREEI